MNTVVYFAQAGDENGPIKIGYSSDVEKRIASLRTGNHLPIRLLAVLPHKCAGTAEKRLHEQFAADRLEGEWFRATPALLMTIQAIKALCSVDVLGEVFDPVTHVRSDLAPIPYSLLSAIRDLPTRSDLGRLSWWVVEWSESQGSTHVTSLMWSLSTTHAVYLFGDGRPNDYQIVGICPTAESADELADKLEPWLKTMRAVRLLAEAR